MTKHELLAENEEMQKQLNRFSEFLCHMTGGLLSKTNYTAQEMISAAEDYQQNVCGECDLRAENEKLRGELESVRAERNAAAFAEIAHAPAADVAPVVHGRWVYGEDVDIQCSVCGADAFTEGDYRQVKSRYCPNCGAKMDLED